jgi:hypothetical protein
MKRFNLGNGSRDYVTPYVRGVETNPDTRIYTFQPETDKPFLISVLLPHDEYGAATMLVAGRAEPDVLIGAILFVESNELKYAECLDLSSDNKRFEKNSDNNKTDGKE